MRNQPVGLVSLASQLQSVVEQLQNMSTDTTTATGALQPNASPIEVTDLSQRLTVLETTVANLSKEILDLKASSYIDRTKLSIVYADLLARNAKQHNEDARAYNATVNRQMNLLSLHDLDTNEPVPGFPKTLACIEHMDGSQLDQLLRSLNADHFPRPQTLDRKQARLVAVVKGVEEEHPPELPHLCYGDCLLQD